MHWFGRRYFYPKPQAPILKNPCGMALAMLLFLAGFWPNPQLRQITTGLK